MKNIVLISLLGICFGSQVSCQGQFVLENKNNVVFQDKGKEDVCKKSSTRDL